MVNQQRRKIIASGTALGLYALTAPVFSQTPRKLTIVSWGGSFQAAQSKAVWQPVAAKLGIKLVEETYNGLADLRLRVRSGVNTWDIVSIGTGGAARAGTEGLLEPIDYKVVGTSGFIDGYTSQFWLGADLYSTAITWNTKKFAAQAPSSWADFWDVKRFPGPRAYRNQALGHLEPALLADGVSPDKVYAELSTSAGLKHAVAKVGMLKPHIASFWASGAQQAQLLHDGAVDMASAWSGQIAPLIQAGSPLAMTFNQAMLDADCWVVPKGAPNRALAMQFLNEASKPSYQAAFSSTLPYGAVNRHAYDNGLIAPAVASKLPSSPVNLAKQLKLDSAWWSKNQARAEQLYQEMLTS